MEKQNGFSELSRAQQLNRAKNQFEKLLKIDLSLVDKRFKLNHPDLDHQTLKTEALKFMAICSVGGKTYAPSEAVDEYWHEAVTVTQSYAKLCDTLGIFVHHIPFGFNDEERAINQRNYANTLEDYTTVFGSPNPTVWKKSATCGNGNCTCSNCNSGGGSGGGSGGDSGGDSGGSGGSE